MILKRIMIIFSVFFLLILFVFTGCNEEKKQTETESTVTEMPSTEPVKIKVSDYVKKGKDKKMSDDVRYTYPQFLIKSDDANTANTEIRDTYDPLFEIFDEADHSFSCTGIKYTCSVFKNYLSVLIKAEYNDTIDYYSVYTFDVNTGKRLSNDQIMEVLGADKEETYKNISKEIENHYTKRYEDYKGESDYKSCLKKSTDIKNIKSTAMMYMNNDGLLRAIVKEYSPDNLNMYDIIIKL